MKTLILSSSLSENSRSFILCKEVLKTLTDEGANCNMIDAKNISMNPTHRKFTEEMEYVKNQVKKSDNIIIGMGVHCYSINDSLKILLDNCFSEATGKFYAILCAAGGQKSYLSTMHLTQICMNEWRMMQLPRVVYATREDFQENIISSSDLSDRIKTFSKEFYSVGKKLLTNS